MAEVNREGMRMRRRNQASMIQERHDYLKEVPNKEKQAEKNNESGSQGSKTGEVQNKGKQAEKKNESESQGSNTGKDTKEKKKSGGQGNGSNDRNNDP